MRKHVEETEQEYWKRIGKTIKGYREENHIPQTKLSERVGVSNDTISRIELGKKHDASFLLICRIGKELGIPLEQMCPSIWRLDATTTIDPLKAREIAENVYQMVKDLEIFVVRKYEVESLDETQEQEDQEGSN